MTTTHHDVVRRRRMGYMTTATRPVLDPATLYLTDDRLVCGTAPCAGMTALYTGRTIAGVPLVVVDADIAALLDPTSTCQCGTVAV